MKENRLSKFINDQLSVWPLASANFRALKSAEVKTLEVNGLQAYIQHNPERIKSTTAEIDSATLASRPCFLCAENRPPEQFHVKFEGRKGRKYNIQLNPYPIFPAHLVIASEEHTPQTIWRRYADMMDLAQKYAGYTVFYNGPFSGASAPDHMHFQACPSGLMPLERYVDDFFESGDDPAFEYLADVREAVCYHCKKFSRGILALKAKTPKSITKLFYRILDAAPVMPGEEEPRFNMFVWAKNNEIRSLIVLRSEIRSHHYFLEAGDADHLTVSPGCADVCGFFVAPHEEDFLKADSRLLGEMMSEVTLSEEEEEKVLWKLTRKQRKIEVGIMSGNEIHFEIISDGAGPQKVSFRDGRIDYNGVLYDELFFDAMTLSSVFAEPSFILKDVTIGVDFHWQRLRDLKYAGSLKFIVENGRITAINVVGLEDYLLSVISSEMKATADIEFLKAHAIISRSWVLRNLGTHEHFDVCADDHCQRYQGLGMAVGRNVRNAIDETWGQVLVCDGQICDARYSKCCGGRTEVFSTCWEGEDLPYLQSFPDSDGSGDPFCDTSDEAVLSKVLNDYDLETKDFFKWEVRMSRSDLSELLQRRTGIDFGTIRSLEALERGPSGRIYSLRITGDKCSEVIGKELAIRHALSESHLKSSAFEISWDGDTLVLEGKGWGHGVGLCQIGAAVMAHKGYDAGQILLHYYPGTKLERI